MSTQWGILSTARINRHILSAASSSPEVDVVAVGSRDRARSEAYAQENDIARACGSYDELLADPEIEAIYISLPNSMHVEWSIRALEAGKHVLCEKPLSRRTQEVEEAFSVAERCDRFLMEAFMYRHNPQTKKLKELVDGGAVGRVRLVRAAFSFTAEDPANIRLVAALDGGSLMDVGCYCVSGARYVAGEPESVFGEQVTNDDRVDLVFAGTLRFGSDVFAQFDSSLCFPNRDELEVIGEEGSLWLDDPWHCKSPVIELRRDSSREEITVEAADSYRLQLENFSRAIRGDAQPLLGRDDAIGQARALEALYRAAEERGPVEVR